MADDVFDGRIDNEMIKSFYKKFEEIDDRAKDSVESLINWSFAISTASLVWVASNIEKLPYIPCSQCALSWYKILFAGSIIFLALSTIGLGLLRALIYYKQYELDSEFEFNSLRRLCEDRKTSILSVICGDYMEYLHSRNADFRIYKKCFLGCSVLYSMGILLIGLNIYYYIFQI